MTGARRPLINLLCFAFLSAKGLSAFAQSSSTSASASSPASAAQDYAIWYREAVSDLVAEKFDNLDRMADAFRRDKSRLEGGEWKLSAFYRALDAPMRTDKDTADHLDHLRKWMTLRPESITARVALATSLTRWAWVARGNGMADTVSKEGWVLFNGRIQEAEAVLEGSRDMKTMCPQWYRQMLLVGMAQSWSKARMQDVHDRGIQFEPDYFPTDIQYATYLLPKWGGKVGLASAFAKAAADRCGGSDGDILYFRLVYAELRTGGREDAQPAEFDWERAQAGERAMVAQFGSVSWFHDELALLAYRFGDRTVAQQQFALIGDNPNGTVWRNRLLFDRARDWSQGKTAWPAAFPPDDGASPP